MRIHSSPSFQLFCIICCVGTRHCISVKLQSEAVDIYMKLCRYKEEEQQLLCEMMSFLAYLKEVVLAGLSLSLTGTHKYVATYVMYVYFFII